MPATTERTCPACGTPLAPKEGERPASFARRKTCGGECAKASRWVVQTETHPFQSRYGGYVTAGVFLAEVVCARQAKQRGEVLPFRFWSSPRWEKQFKWQVLHASRLLKKYRPAAVSRALRAKECQRVNSLGAPWLIPAIERAQFDLTQEEEARAKAAPAEPTPPPTTTAPPRAAHINRPTVLGKLKGL